MTWWQAILLGVLQGVTEFLPVSSSGHLVLAQHFFDFAPEKDARAIFFDGCLHLGTLGSVLLFFGLEQRRRLPLAHLPEGSTFTSAQALRLGFLVAVASLPAIAVSLVLSEHIKDTFTNPRMVGVSFLILGLLLLFISRQAAATTAGLQTRPSQAFLIGIGQALSAVCRGLSRSGMTISAAILVGLERTWAVRFSFLMSLVASLGLGGLGIYKGIRDPTASSWLTPDFIAMTAVATIVSGLVGFLTIRPLLHLVRRCQLWWFSIYLWIVGAVTLVLLGATR